MMEKGTPGMRRQRNLLANRSPIEHTLKSGSTFGNFNAMNRGEWFQRWRRARLPISRCPNGSSAPASRPPFPEKPIMKNVRLLSVGLCAAFILCTTANTHGDVKLPTVLDSHMVLQRTRPSIFGGGLTQVKKSP